MFRVDSNKWIEILGTDYVRMAFKITRDELNTWPINERPKLVYNDYDILWKSVKSDAVYELIKYLNSEEKLVDAVGFQSHLWSDFLRNGVISSATKELKHTSANTTLLAHQTVPENLKRFADLGLDVYITEMDVRIRDFESRSPFAGRTTEFPLSVSRNNDQYNVYKTVFSYCLAEPACNVFQLWGVTDASSWVSGQQPLIFKGHAVQDPLGDWVFERKPAYYGLQDAMFDFMATK